MLVASTSTLLPGRTPRLALWYSRPYAARLRTCQIPCRFGFPSAVRGTVRALAAAAGVAGVDGAAATPCFGAQAATTNASRMEKIARKLRVNEITPQIIG